MIKSASALHIFALKSKKQKAKSKKQKAKCTAQGDAFIGGSSTWARTRDLRINRNPG
jgi:hypothetical protein